MVNITNPFIACTQLAGETGPITLVTFFIQIVTPHGTKVYTFHYHMARERPKKKCWSVFSGKNPSTAKSNIFAGLCQQKVFWGPQS